MPLNPDAIPTSEQVQETLLDRFYYPYKKQIWAAGTLLALGILGFLGAREWRLRQQNDQWQRYETALAAGDRGGAPGAAAEQRETLLLAVLKDYPDGTVAPYALQDLALTYAELERYDDAIRTLEDLRKGFKDYVANTESSEQKPGARSISDRLEAVLRAEKDWRASTAYVHPAPKPDRQALVETTAGDFWLGFYPDQAPAHVESFIATAKSGFYNGSQVYDVRKGGPAATSGALTFEAGSAASRYQGSMAVRDPGAHDSDEPDATIEPEDSRFTIRHRRGVVTSVVMPSGESARRFLVVCAQGGMETTLNGNASPFAAVLDKEKSLEAIDRIALSPTYGTDATTEKHPETARMRDHPYPPIWIRRVTIWKDEKLEDGHKFDTSRAAAKPPQPEPWEANLPKPPLPEEFAPK